MGGKGSGRKATHNDLYHKLVREHQRIYTEKNREALRLAGRLRISVKEARRRLKQKRGKEN